MKLRHRIALTALLAAGPAAWAQSGAAADQGRVQILNADQWDFDQAVATGAQRLKGHVRFRHADALMACDSAWLFDDQRVLAFGNVNLVQGDTLRITGERLRYSGPDHLARMEGNVRLSDPGMLLTTEALSYDTRARSAHYDQGARIVDLRDQNTLTSLHGTYRAAGHLFIFSDSVRLEHPERTITADTLHYSTSSGTAIFLGPTHITQGETRMYCERGSYDTRAGQGRFTRAGRISSGGQTLSGDSLHFDRNTGTGAGWGHVALADSVNNLLVLGDHGTHAQRQGRSMVTGRAELVLLFGKDSLHLHADTLFGHTDSLGGRRITARRNVRFFKPDMQGVCDTMVYDGADSLITLRGDPFLWNKESQISGRVIRLKLRNGHAHALYVHDDAFMASQVDSSRFDQVTGLAMTGYFQGDELRRLITEGNSRTAYFAKERKDGAQQVTGVNRADCSTITVDLDSGKVQAVSFITQPDATLYPIAKAPPEALRLDGFRWNAEARPADRADIFRRTESDDRARAADP